MMFRYTVLVLIMSLLLAVNVSAQEPDWSHYQGVLHHLKPGVKNQVELMLVDYAALKSTDSLEQAYQTLADFNLKLLSGRAETLAFYINAYNILALKKVTDHWPTKSIKDSGNFFSPVWNKPAGMLGGKATTLGEIEHNILRPMGEPSIHFAIVCASVSCPDLRNQPYTAAHLDKQLDDQARQFLNNPGKGLRIDNKTIQVSKIFDWFEDDFEAVGGVLSFIKRYRIDLPDLKLKTTIPYDWNVNALD